MMSFIWVFLIVFISSLFVATLPLGYYVIWFDYIPIFNWSIRLLPPVAFSIVWTGFIAAIWISLYINISTSLQDRE